MYYLLRAAVKCSSNRKKTHFVGWWCAVPPFILLISLLLSLSPLSALPPPAGAAFPWAYISSDAWWPDGIITQFQLQCAEKHGAGEAWPQPWRRISWHHKKGKKEERERDRKTERTKWFVWTAPRPPTPLCVCVSQDFNVTLSDRWHNLIMNSIYSRSAAATPTTASRVCERVPSPPSTSTPLWHQRMMSGTKY